MAEIRLTPEQQKVVDTRNCNLLVAAAAGSGKTAVLVKRIIKKVTEEGQDIDRLLIVTFTNAAAAEMRERIGAAIEEALAAQPESAHLQRQMMLLHNAQITTIHSFCLSVIREFFHLLSLDPGFRIGDEAELSLLRSDVLEEVLEECYEKEEETFLALVESFGSAKNDNAVKEYILKLYHIAMSQPYANDWLDSLSESFRIPANEFGSHPMLARVMQEVTNCLADCRAVLERLFALAEEPDGPSAYKENFQADEAELLRLSSASTDYVTFATALSELKFTALSRKKQEASEEKKELAKSLRDHIKKQLKKLQEDFFYEAPEEMWKSITHMELPMRGLVFVTKEMIARYEEQKKEKNLLDFNDLEHMALRILVERTADGAFVPTKAAKTLSARFDEIMIDEYQDSNLIQEAILTSVSGAWRDNPNVFMVGDVKQSIYRFRMACPDLFMEKYETYGTEGKAQKIDLAKNFRSRQGILDAINVLFAGLMHKESTEVEYDAAASLYFGASYPKEKSAHCTEVLFVNAEATVAAEADGFGDEELPWNSDEGADDGSDASSKPEDGELGAEEKSLVQAEAYAVANRIKELISSDLTVGSDERGVNYGDIVILLRTMSGWSEAFLEVFAEQGIPAYADTSAGYFKTFEIRKTLDFLRILDNPKQDIPFAAVLHSPIGGFNAEELATLRVKYGSVSAENKTSRCLYAAAREAANNALGSNDGVNSKAAKFFELYDRLRAESEYISIHELIESFYCQSGFYDVVTVMPGGERRRGNLDMLITRAKQYEATSFSGLYDFIRYIDRLIKYEVDFGEAGTVEAGQMVRIMSIHKSKGLEFPVVFLCGMEKKMNRMDMRDRLIIHSKLGLGPEFVDTALRVKSPTLLKKIIAKQMNEEMIAEELRVLYVAMTRAREKLILVGAMKEPEKRYAAWQQRSETVSERGLLSSYVSKANTYYDFVCPLLMAGKVNTGENGVNCVNSAEVWNEILSSGVQVSITKHMETEEFPEAVFTGRFILRECGAVERALQAEENRRTKQELLAVLEQMKTMEPSSSEEAKAVRELLELQNSFKYPYDTEANLPIKVTVSELKRMHLEADEQEGMDTALAGSNCTGSSVQSLLPDEVSFDDISFEDISFDTMDAQGNFVLQLDSTGELMVPEDDCTYPEFLKPEKTISGSDRGTIYHHIMELIPFAANMPKNAVKATLDGMVKDGRLKPEDRDAVNDNKFVKFFASELGIRMCRAEDAGTLRREQPFVIGLPAKELYPDSESDEIVLVQGVIDAFFEEEDGIVLMDYKTDRIHENAKAELTKKYQSQLGYYRTALEKLTGKPVKEVWFYAFGTGEDFRIE
ncbi:MAG: helicase-exonuclease AddAB subunit AddA [Lachnospiraceae bacterium]|nr:helicase-exonuclease AddAB subunit AddA [Lachnospiraceae bacterium]